MVRIGKPRTRPLSTEFLTVVIAEVFFGIVALAAAGTLMAPTAASAQSYGYVPGYGGSGYAQPFSSPSASEVLVRALARTSVERQRDPTRELLAPLERASRSRSKKKRRTKQKGPALTSPHPPQ